MSEVGCNVTFRKDVCVQEINFTAGRSSLLIRTTAGTWTRSGYRGTGVM